MTIQIQEEYQKILSTFSWQQYLDTKSSQYPYWALIQTPILEDTDVFRYQLNTTLNETTKQSHMYSSSFILKHGKADPKLEPAGSGRSWGFTFHFPLAVCRFTRSTLVVKTPTTTSIQLNTTTIDVGFDTIMTVHTPPPPHPPPRNSTSAKHSKQCSVN